MPFAGPNDPKLPSNVQKLTEPQRQKWVSTFNGFLKNCMDPKTGGGAGALKKCEETAFKVANGTIKKEVGVVENKETTADKGHPDETGRGPVPVVIVDQNAPQGPFAGAQSFEELEEWRKAQDQAGAVHETTWETKILMENVMDSDDDLAGKPGKIKKIASGFQKRVAEILSDMSKAVEPNAEKQETKTEDGVKFKASDYAVVPDSDKPSTWKLRLAEKSSGNFTVRQVAAAITAMQPGGFRGQRVQLTGDQKKQAVSRIGTAIGKSDGNDDQKENLRRRLNAVKDVKDAAMFVISKDKDGAMRWIGIPSNKWRDRDNPQQIIEEAAHKDFIEYLDESKDYPVLLSWHTPGTRIGVADFADYSNGFLIMGGPIDKEKYAEAEKLAEKCQHEDIGMSHGFVYTYSDKEQEIIGHYRTWEVSHLPIDKAANVWTAMDILKKEVKQMFDPEKRKYIVGLHGEEVAVALESKVTDLEKDLTSLGIESKDLGLPGSEAVSTETVVQDTVKALVESDGFKAMITAISSLTDGVKELKETTIPGLGTRLDAMEAVAKATAEKAGKTVDEIIADAFKAQSAGFQASEKGDPPTVAEKTEEEATSVKAPVNEDMLAGFFKPSAPAQ